MRQRQFEQAVNENNAAVLWQMFEKMLDKKISFGEYLAETYRRKKGLKEPVSEEGLIEGIRQEFRKNGMYRLRLETITFPEGMSRNEKEKWLFGTYEYKNIERSSKAVMGSIDFLSNTRTLDKKDLKDRFVKPVDKVTREELFLFAFGLGLTVEEVVDFIQQYFGEPGFRWKDYKEVIYFWCLRNQEMHARSDYCGIEGVWNALRYYYRTPKTARGTVQRDVKTYYYEERVIRSGRTDVEFRAHLGMLKERQPESGYSVTRSEILKKNLKQLHVWISEDQNAEAEEKKSAYQERNRMIEKRGFSWQNRAAQKKKANLLKQMDKLDISGFERDLWSCVDDRLRLSMEPELIKRIGFPPIWRNALIGEKVNSHTKDTSRKDILISRFLYYAFKKEFSRRDDQSELDEYIQPEKDDYAEDDLGLDFPDWDFFGDEEEELEEMTDLLEIKEAFEAMAGLDLAECGMYEGLYLPNPFELFMLLCMQSEVPYSVFMNAWDTAVKG